MVITNYKENDADLGDIYVTKEYVMEYYADLIPGVKAPALFLWGRNMFGQLGNNSAVDRSSPVTTSGGGINWKQIVCAPVNTAAVKTDGTLWTWGAGQYGVLGNGGSLNRSSPGTTSGGGTNWGSVSVGSYHMSAVKTDGTLWTWGQNTYGQLGNNSTTDKNSPITTSGGGTNWKQTVCGFSNIAAIKTDGTLWTWGNGQYGGLGNDATTNRSSPGSIHGEGTNWKQVSSGNNFAAAIKTDGTLWAWGANFFGALGDNSATSKSSPVTTHGEGTNWKQVSCGYYTAAAIKTDGTLWTWGSGSNGILGNNATTDISSPITTSGAGTNWKKFSIGYHHIAAIKTDGTLWTWGEGTYGVLGNNATTNRSSPGSIHGVGTNWKAISSSFFTSGAISESEGW